MRPVSRPGLHVLSARTETAPGRIVAAYVDGWGTAVDVVEVDQPFALAEYGVIAEVSTGRPAAETPPRPDEWLMYRAESPRVPLAPACTLGWQVGDEGQSWDAVESALGWMPGRFHYRVGATEATTPLEDFLALGSGVCQDFAHAFLALTRSWGWCARYVSGYVFATDDQASIVEAEAMHAWVEVYRADIGWVGLDPTTGKATDERSIPVGVARDYDDLRPVRGVIAGASRQSQEAQLRVAAVSGQ
jgi:transglutaminase-like putative cysteine protease